MLQRGDFVVLILIAVVIVFWMWWRFRRWVYEPFRPKLPFPDVEPFVRSEAVELLEAAGYEVVCGKKKVPLLVELDDEQLESRVFVDYFARKDHELFVVKVSNARKPVQWTGSGIRERFMIYCYLFEEAHGVLYVDLDTKQVRKIAVQIGMAE